MADNNLGPANNYDFTKSHFDVLANVFATVKNEINNSGGWYKPIETQDGITFTFVGQNMVQLMHTKYVVANPYTMKMKQLPEGSEFVDALIKELSKKYKAITKNTITFKQVKEDHDIQLYSKISGDRSWIMGGGSGYSSAMARYLVTTRKVFEVKTKLIKDL